MSKLVLDIEEASLVLEVEGDTLVVDRASSGPQGPPGVGTPAQIKAAYESNPDTNEFNDAEKAKLATVEENAKDDQDGAEIKILYEAELDTNAFTDADLAKLTGIEAGATGDQTGTEIKLLYEAELDTNAFTDLLLTKLNNIEDNATVDQTGAEIKVLYEGEVDTNAFTDAEKTKLLSVESGATGDQTDAEIKTAYENNADTNAYTDAEKSKLGGIEANATADQSASEIKIAYESNANTNEFADSEKSKLATVEPGATADQTDLEIKTAYENNANTNAFTNAEQTLVAGSEQSANKGVNNGYAPLDASGKVPAANLPASVQNGEYLGSWNALTNTPAITNGVGNQGDNYLIGVTGAQDLGNGLQTYYEGDEVKYDGAEWDSFGRPDNVQSVAGKQGVVTLDAADIAETAGLKIMTVAERNKLAGVESGATADQDGAEIKTLYEAEADTNAFNDAAVSKLSGIEANATADQTGGEIKIAYEAEADTNAFDDAAVSKLAGIEGGATGDQTGSEIKTLYEAEADTNAFTDALLSKLTGIAPGANNYSHPNHSGHVVSVADGVTIIQAGVIANSMLDAGLQTKMGYLDQPLLTTSSPTFEDLTVDGDLKLGSGGSEINWQGGAATLKADSFLFEASGLNMFRIYDAVANEIEVLGSTKFTVGTGLASFGGDVTVSGALLAHTISDGSGQTVTVDAHTQFEGDALFNYQGGDQDFTIFGNGQFAYRYNGGTHTHIFDGETTFNNGLKTNDIEAVSGGIVNISDSIGMINAAQIIFDGGTGTGTLNGNITISGDLNVLGDSTITDIETVTVNNPIAGLNEGETFAGVTAGFAGVEIDRGTENPYRFVFDEVDDSFKIGQYYGDATFSTITTPFVFGEEITGATSGAKARIYDVAGSPTLKIRFTIGTFLDGEAITGDIAGAGTLDTPNAIVYTDETQHVATRSNAMINGGVGVWNSSTFQFESFTGLTFDGADLFVSANIDADHIHLTRNGTVQNHWNNALADGVVQTVYQTEGLNQFTVGTDNTGFVDTFIIGAGGGFGAPLFTIDRGSGLVTVTNNLNVDGVLTVESNTICHAGLTISETSGPSELYINNAGGAGLVTRRESSGGANADTKVWHNGTGHYLFSHISTIGEIQFQFNAVPKLTVSNTVVTVADDLNVGGDLTCDTFREGSGEVVFTANTNNVLFNAEFNDRDFIVRKNGSFEAVNYNAGNDTWLFKGDMGFYGATPVAQASTPVTLGDVIAVLQNLGLTA